jgi:hypothetical protein
MSAKENRENSGGDRARKFGSFQQRAAEKIEEAEITRDEQATSKARMPLMLGVAGATVGLAIVCVVGAVIYSYSGATRCEAKAVIVKPENGETIAEATEIEVETENADCATRAIFLINGAEFASSTEQPFTAQLDPKQFPELANGSLQSLQIVLEDAEGNKIVQPTEVALAFETIEIADADSDAGRHRRKSDSDAFKSRTKVSGGDTQEMSKNLVKEFSGTFNYKFDQQFVAEVQKKTAEYAAEGYYARAPLTKMSSVFRLCRKEFGRSRSALFWR